MSRKVNYFEAQRLAPNRDDTTLSVIVSDYIPTTLSALETRSRRSFWATDEDFTRAYNEISRQQWELLMDATDRIVMEVRALRDGPDTALAAQDPLVNPFTLDLFSLRSIAGRLSSDGESAAFILKQIRDRVGDSESDGTLLWAIIRIAGVIVGAA